MIRLRKYSAALTKEKKKEKKNRRGEGSGLFL
jgi:hypothetical protein